MSGDRATLPGILCFAGNDWWLHNPYTEKQWMRRLAARGWRILFINSIGIGLPSPRSPMMARRVFRKFLGMLRWLRRSEGVWILTPLVLPFWSLRPVARFNAWLLALQIRLLLRVLGMPRPLFWSGIPTAALLAGRVPHGRVLYYFQDNFPAYYDAMLFSRVAESHEAMLRIADLVLYASAGLFERHPSPVPARCIPHGVDDRFLAAGEALATTGHPHRDGQAADGPSAGPPPELASLPRPIVGYWGSLEALQDIPLIAALARLRPAWSFVFIGKPMCDISPLRGLPNLHFTGYVPPDRLPSFGAQFDVAIIPMRQTPWLLYSNPVKLREYYALGLPVVSVPILEIARNFPDAFVAGDAEGFAAAIERAVATDSPEARAARRRAVAGLSWDATTERVDALLRMLAADGGAASPGAAS